MNQGPWCIALPNVHDDDVYFDENGRRCRSMTEISNEYQAYLDQKQSRWNTPEAQLRELVRRSCGCDWTRLERVIKGGENEVYMMTTERGEDLVVRILREERDGVPGEPQRKSGASTPAEKSACPCLPLSPWIR